MEKIEYKIKDRDGVHARPAGAILQSIKGYKSDIQLIHKDHTINLKGGIFSLLGLGIRYEDVIYIKIEGEDEKEAAEGVKAAFEKYL